MKTIQQRKSYIAHKSKQLDIITDAHKYTRRLARVMQYHKLLSVREAAAAQNLIKGDEEMEDRKQIRELIKELETKCKSSKGSMGVYIDEIESPWHLFENVKDEICSTEITLDAGYIVEDRGMSVREAKGYLTKLNNFLKRHSAL